MQPVFGGALFGKAVALQFDIEPVAENLRQLFDRRFRGLGLAVHEQTIDRPAWPAGQRDQTFRMFGEHRRLYMRPVPGSALRNAALSSFERFRYPASF